MLNISLLLQYSVVQILAMLIIFMLHLEILFVGLDHILGLQLIFTVKKYKFAYNVVNI